MSWQRLWESCGLILRNSKSVGTTPPDCLEGIISVQQKWTNTIAFQALQWQDDVCSNSPTSPCPQFLVPNATKGSGLSEPAGPCIGGTLFGLMTWKPFSSGRCFCPIPPNLSVTHAVQLHDLAPKVAVVEL